jgi:hypothetical protein
MAPPCQWHGGEKGRIRARPGFSRGSPRLASQCAGHSEEQKLHLIGPQGPGSPGYWGSSLVLAIAAPLSICIGHGGTGTAADPAPRRSSGLICVHSGACAPQVRLAGPRPQWHRRVSGAQRRACGVRTGRDRCADHVRCAAAPPLTPVAQPLLYVAAESHAPGIAALAKDERGAATLAGERGVAPLAVCAITVRSMLRVAALAARHRLHVLR